MKERTKRCFDCEDLYKTIHRYGRYCPKCKEKRWQNYLKKRNLGEYKGE